MKHTKQTQTQEASLLRQVSVVLLGLCVSVNLALADVDFRAAWQGEWQMTKAQNKQTKAQNKQERHAKTRANTSKDEQAPTPTKAPKLLDSNALPTITNITIADCRENVCAFKAYHYGALITQATIRLLDYTQAELVEYDVLFRTIAGQDNELQIPMRFRIESTSKQPPHAKQLERSTSHHAPNQATSTHQSKWAVDSSVWERVRVFPSFSCKKARTANEKAICASDASNATMLGLFDIVLHDTYALLYANQSPAKKRTLQSTQKLWLNELKACNGDESCLLDGYKARLLELEEQYCNECN